MTQPGRTYGTLRLLAEQWELSALEPHVSIRLKHLFPRVPKQSTGPFHFPRDAITAADVDNLLWQGQDAAQDARFHLTETTRY